MSLPSCLLEEISGVWRALRSLFFVIEKGFFNGCSRKLKLNSFSCFSLLVLSVPFLIYAPKDRYGSVVASGEKLIAMAGA